MNTEIIGTIVLIVVIVQLFYAIILHTIWPKWLAPKPHIEYEADHYFISESQAGHDMLIFNRGRGKAHDIDFYVEFKAPFKIIGITSNPKGDKEILGQSAANWHAHWKTLAPKNFISIRILSEADKNNPTSVFPSETFVSDRDKFISRMYEPTGI